MSTFRIDVSRRGDGDKIPAWLVIETSSEVSTRTAREVLYDFKRCVSDWLRDTPQGRKAWKRSSHEFNYGDFVMESVEDDPAFQKLLRSRMIHSVRVESMPYARDLGETYDTVMSPDD